MLRNKWVLFIAVCVCVMSFTSCYKKVEQASYKSEFFFSSPKDKATVQILSKNIHQNALGEIAIDHGDIYYITQSYVGTLNPH